MKLLGAGFSSFFAKMFAKRFNPFLALIFLDAVHITSEHPR